MRPSIQPADSRRLRSVAVVLAMGLLASACAGSTATAAPTAPPATIAPASATPAASTAPTPTPGPATAQLTIAGDPAIAGTISDFSVQCDAPSFTGLQIVLFHQSGPSGLGVRLVVSNGQVSLRYASGAGKTYVDREFTGTGVTGFDAATGAQIDSNLDTAPYAGATGTLGAITSIKGSVSCGNQQPGSSTMTLSGTTAAGQISGVKLDPVRVECDFSSTYGQSVIVSGIATIGSTPTLFIIDGRAGQFTVAQEPQSGTTAFYVGKAPGADTLSQDGVHISGDATEQVPAGSTPSPYSVTVAGDATCGSTVNS